MRARAGFGWWTVCLVSLLAYEAAASSRLLQGRGKGYGYHVQCCPQGCGIGCNGGGGGGGGGGSTLSAYAFIASQPDLSTAKYVIDQTGLQSALQAPFANTLFVPNNAALDAYAARITANVTWDTDIGSGFLKLFFTKVLQYHTLTGSYGMSDLVAGDIGTLYVSNNGMPHKVTTTRGNILVDEQGNSVGITGPSQAVTGGGYVHAITGVLQANDIFPSLTEVLASDQFSQLRAVISKIENTDPNPPLTALLEGISGTLALPNNQAFQGVDVANTDAKTLLDVVTYHICPFKRMYRLLYTPFTVGRKPGKNPCLPVFSRAYAFPYGLKWAYNSPSNITVTFATGTFPDGLVADDASIVFADISIPTQSAHVISSLIMPPANISAASASASVSASAASSKQHTTRLINILEALSTNNRVSKQQGSSSNANSGWTKNDDDADDDVHERATAASETPVSASGTGSQGSSGSANAGARGAKNNAILDSLIAVPDYSSSSSSSSMNRPASKGREQEDTLQQQQQQQQQQQPPQQPPASKLTARRHRNRRNNSVVNSNDLAALQAGGSSSSSSSSSSHRTRRQRTDNKSADGTPAAGHSSAAQTSTGGSAGSASPAGSGGAGNRLAAALAGLTIPNKP